MGVINMAHGELMMIGAYTMYLVQNSFGGLGGVWFESYIFLALPTAFLVAALGGLMLERWVIRYLYGRPLETLLATWGVSLILQQFVRSVNWAMVIGLVLWGALILTGRLLVWPRWGNLPWMSRVWVIAAGALAWGVGALAGERFGLALEEPWFGAEGVDVNAPDWLQGGIPLGDFQLPASRLFIISLTSICLLGLYLFLQKSPWGLRIRAVTQNRSMSACLGIPTGTVDALTFALGSGLAGVAGCAVSLLGSVDPNLGQEYIVNTFMVVVVGGVGNLVGSVVAAMTIGILQDLFSSGILPLLLGDKNPLTGFFNFFATDSMAKVIVFALIIIFLQVRPAGMFPQKGRSVDA